GRGRPAPPRRRARGPRGGGADARRGGELPAGRLLEPLEGRRPRSGDSGEGSAVLEQQLVAALALRRRGVVHGLPRIGRAGGAWIPRTELKPLPGPAEPGSRSAAVRAAEQRKGSLSGRHAIAVLDRDFAVAGGPVARDRLVRIAEAVAIAVRRAPPAEQAAAPRRCGRQRVPARAGGVERVPEHETKADR